jgi:hypothetical protein
VGIEEEQEMVMEYLLHIMTTTEPILVLSFTTNMPSEVGHILSHIAARLQVSVVIISTKPLV